MTHSARGLFYLSILGLNRVEVALVFERTADGRGTVVAKPSLDDGLQKGLCQVWMDYLAQTPGPIQVEVIIGETYSHVFLDRTSVTHIKDQTHKKVVNDMLRVAREMFADVSFLAEVSPTEASYREAAILTLASITRAHPSIRSNECSVRMISFASWLMQVMAWEVLGLSFMPFPLPEGCVVGVDVVSPLERSSMLFPAIERGLLDWFNTNLGAMLWEIATRRTFSPIVCPWCAITHPYPNDGRAINSPRLCSCGANWAVELEPGDFWSTADPAETEMRIIPGVGDFEGQDTPGDIEPTHAIFWRPKVHCVHVASHVAHGLHGAHGLSEG